MRCLQVISILVNNAGGAFGSQAPLDGEHSQAVGPALKSAICSVCNAVDSACGASLCFCRRRDGGGC